MNTHTVGMVVALAFFSLAQAAEQDPEWDGTQPLKGHYQVYGGTLSEKLPPTPKDRKVAFVFKGLFAKDLFNQIGPDVKKEDACSSATNYRERRRGDVDCVYTKDSGYSCYFGLDVTTGKSTYGAIC
ncbi:MAG: hypothetical protein H7335_05675 [Massilia sp.]|nr:hypothetical protein [Massilia sp.]